MDDSIKARLRVYHDLLIKWQKSVNLVAPSTLAGAWERHFEDSIQVAEYLPEGIKSIADLGSGAGFPGLVLGVIRSDLEVHLIESDSKKASVLKVVSRETGAVNIHVHNGRIESVLPSLEVDVVTARALSNLTNLLDLSESQWGRAAPAFLIFMKGADSQNEAREARRFYDFDMASHPSKTDGNAAILCITGVVSKGQA